MTSRVEPKRMTDAQVFEWLRSTRHMLGDVLADMMEAHLAALSPPTPEDVARDYEEVNTLLAKHVHGCDGEVALDRLHGWAARVPGLDAARKAYRQRAYTAESERDAAHERAVVLEQSERDLGGHVANLEKVLAAERESLRLSRENAEGFRNELDAARQEVNKAREWATSCENEREAAASERDAARKEADALRQTEAAHRHEVADLKRQNDALRERVATLGRDLENHKAAVDGLESLWEQQKARAEAAERRVQEVEGEKAEVEERLNETRASLDGCTQRVAELAAAGPRITPMERLVDVARRLAGGANTRAVWDDLDAALVAYDASKATPITHPAPAGLPHAMRLAALGLALRVVSEERAKWGGAVHTACDAITTRLRYLSQYQFPPAPAGLLEALTPFLPLLRELAVQRLDNHSPAHLSALYKQDVEVGHVRVLLAAHDAAKGGERPITACPCTGGYVCQPGCGGCEVKGAKGEPTVTHAAFAAVVERLRDFAAAVDDADWENVGELRSSLEAQSFLASEALFRVTDGRVSSVAEWKEKAAKWDAAVERVKDHAELEGVVEAETEEVGTDLSTPDVRMSVGCAVACHVLGLTLDTPPSGPKEPECPGPDCVMCSGEACNKCGKGCWNDNAPHCEHGSDERHDDPETPPSGPGGGEPNRPEISESSTDAATREWHGCSDPAGHTFNEGRCVQPNCGMDLSRPSHAHAEPAAPEVVLDRDGVRVEKWPEAGDYTIHFSAGGSAKALDVLARALAEATRENHLLKAEISEHLRAWMSARKAAESMRERAELVLYEAAAETRHPEQRDRLLSLGHSIRALSLEDK